MSTEKMRRLAAGYKEGAKSFMASYKLRAEASPLSGEITFCPYCAARTVDAGPQRTYCTTCGEDIVTPEQIEDLEDQVVRLTDQNKDLEKEVERAVEDLGKEEQKVLALYLEIDSLTDDKNNVETLLDAAQRELSRWEEAYPNG